MGEVDLDRGNDFLVRGKVEIWIFQFENLKGDVIFYFKLRVYKMNYIDYVCVYMDIFK